MSTQLAGTLARLRTAPEGTHVLHVHVDPEDLGPVRVTAHIGAEGVRIELLGVTDAARDALRGALSELRRDLAATGLQADLDLAADDQPQERPERAAPGERRGEHQSRTAAPSHPTPAAPAHPGGLDLLA